MIRQENLQDYDKVYRLITDAFASAEHSDGNEQDLVVALRKSDAFIPELSLVDERDGSIVGHIMFTKGYVEEQLVLVLAPLSVLPAYQKKGVGSALIEEGHKIARQLGYQYSMVLGSDIYYSKFGYVPAETLGVRVPDGIPRQYFMGRKLNDDAQAVHGSLKYPKEFGI